jgi:multisubunit Na+/H+ antiporter MnhB subunit
MAFAASALLGGAVGLICVTILAVALRRLEEKDPKETINVMWKLIAVALGGGFADYMIFDVILSTSGAIWYYIFGFSAAFVALGLIVFLDWRRG